MLRCPLCLRELKPTDQFRLVCLEHDVSDDGKATVHVIDCTDENLRRLRCQTAKCQADFWSGIFLSHVGCSVKHPWVATGTRAASPSPVKAPRAKVTAAWEDDDEEPEPESTPVQPAAAPIVGDVVQMGAPDPAYTTAALGGETVTHKMISALWRLPKNTPEMWFPLVMLRAMRPGNSTGSAVVQVSGSTGAGKTVLSLQAQHHFGYRVPGDGHIPRFDLESFVHMSDTDCLVNAYGYLAAADKLRVEKKPITTRAMLDGIRGALGDVKAVFFKVPEKAAGKAQQSGLASWLSVFSSGEKAERARRSWQTLMFFDVPGEMVERQAPILTSISQAAHRVAVVINAEDLLAEGSGETLHVACKELARLRKAPRARQACIVVTQMDKVRSHVSLEDWAQIEKVTLTGKGGMKLLKGWVKALGKRHRDIADLFLAGAATSGTPVFFVWTTGLDDSGEESSAPTSYGLRPFVSWCLEQPQETIFVKLDPSEEEEAD